MQRNTVFFVCCYSLQSDRYLRKFFLNFNDEVCVWIVVFFLMPFCLVLFCFSVFISVIESLKKFLSRSEKVCLWSINCETFIVSVWELPYPLFSKTFCSS